MSSGCRVGRAAAAVLVAGLVIAACSLPGVSRTTESLRVARPTLPVLALSYIAEARGYFDEEGLEVRFDDFATGIEGLEQTLTGAYDLAIAYSTPFAHKVCAGEDLGIVTTLHTSSRSSALVWRRDSGIASPADLRGKTVGVARGTSGGYFLHVFLLSHGLDPADVRVVDVPIRQTLERLEAGEIDAAVMWHPYLRKVEEREGESAFTVFRSDVYVEFSLVMGKRDVLETKSEAILRFLRALARAEDFYRTQTPEARRIVNDVFVRASLSVEDDIWEDFDPGLGLSHLLLLTLEQEVAWLRDAEGCPGESVGMRQRIFGNFLREARPEAVTLPRLRLKRIGEDAP